jgi:hypothetical protein
MAGPLKPNREDIPDKHKMRDTTHTRPHAQAVNVNKTAPDLGLFSDLGLRGRH